MVKSNFFRLKLIHYQAMKIRKNELKYTMKSYATSALKFTTRHLHHCIQEHRYSAIGKHLTNIHGGIDTSSLSSYFSVLKNCQTKFDCLLYQN